MPIVSYGPLAKMTPTPDPGRVRKSPVLIGLQFYDTALQSYIKGSKKSGL